MSGKHDPACIDAPIDGGRRPMDETDDAREGVQEGAEGMDQGAVVELLLMNLLESCIGDARGTGGGTRSIGESERRG